MGEGRGETQSGRKEERGEKAGKRGAMFFIFNACSQRHESENRRQSSPVSNTEQRAGGLYPADTLQDSYVIFFPPVCVEGRGKAEAAEKAPGAPDVSPSTLPKKLAATARPGAMETPHSPQEIQPEGKSPDSSVFSYQQHTECSLLPVYFNNPAGGGLDSGFKFRERLKLLLLLQTAQCFRLSRITPALQKLQKVDLHYNKVQQKTLSVTTGKPILLTG